MKYLPIFNKGDKVTVNNKYLGLKSMVGEIYTIRAGPAVCSDTWCYWLENVAGGIAADALEPLEQTKEEWIHTLNTEQLAEFLIASIKKCKSCASGIGIDEVQHCPFGECGCHFKDEVIKWLKQPHKRSDTDE